MIFTCNVVLALNPKSTTMGWSCGTVAQFSRLPSTAYLAGEIPLPSSQAGLDSAKLPENDISPAITINGVTSCSESVWRIVCISGTLHVRHEHNILWNSCIKYLLPIKLSILHQFPNKGDFWTSQISKIGYMRCTPLCKSNGTFF